MDYTIRDATADDLPAINEIYNHFVLTCTATFQEQPTSDDERIRWWNERNERYAVLVAEEAGRVIGWAGLSPHAERSAYRFTVDDAIYLRPETQGRGLGTKLLAALLQRAGQAGFRSVIARIASEQAGSLRLHERLGFREVGRLREAGFKFGRWLDIVLMQRNFTDADAKS